MKDRDTDEEQGLLTEPLMPIPEEQGLSRVCVVKSQMHPG
jgi:hypothetical protein